MMETTEGINNFWSELDENDCPCHGSGWADVNGKDETCSLHYKGQLHPETQALLLDEPKRLADEERKSNLKWKISQCSDRITALKSQLNLEQVELNRLSLELINRTPTTKLQAVVVPLEARGNR